MQGIFVKILFMEECGKSLGNMTLKEHKDLSTNNLNKVVGLTVRFVT